MEPRAMLEHLCLLFLVAIWLKSKKKYQQHAKAINNYMNFSLSIPDFSRNLDSTMVIYITCNEPEFPAHRLNVPSYNIKCNKSLKHLLCNEALPMLEFFIEFYGRFPAEKFVFIHGHEKSWHYRSSVIDVINRLVNTSSYKNNDYGGLYRGWWHYNTDFNSYDERGSTLQQMFKEVYGGTSVFKYFRGHHISFPCCSTFYIDSSLINKNPLSLYKQVHERLIRWSENRIANNQSAILCGYLMEYSWNMLFNVPSISSSTAIAY